MAISLSTQHLRTKTQVHGLCVGGHITIFAPFRKYGSFPADSFFQTLAAAQVSNKNSKITLEGNRKRSSTGLLLESRKSNVAVELKISGSVNF